MDWANFWEGYASAIGTFGLGVVVAGVRFGLDKRRKRKGDDVNLIEVICSHMDIWSVNLAEDIRGENIVNDGYEVIKTLKSEYAYPIKVTSDPNFRVSRHLTKVWPKYQRAARELRDTINFYEGKNWAKR